jgi:hypothetical protein
MDLIENAEFEGRKPRGGSLMSRAHHSKPTPRDCEDEQRRSEGSESGYSSPDEGDLSFFIIIVRAMRLHLILFPRRKTSVALAKRFRTLFGIGPS